MGTARAILGDVEALLRGEGGHAVGGARAPWGRLALWLTVCGVFYGAVMGSFGDRGLQSLYSASKVPVLLLLTTAICIPNFFVWNAILGLGADFAAACRGVLAAQATLAVALVGFAPVTLFFYASSSSYPFALTLNGAVFAAASIAGQVTLARHYRPLIAKNPRHRFGLAAWLILYIFVAIQMGSVLRPFVGDPKEPTTFFRERAFRENPYATIFWAIVGMFL